MPGGRGEVCFSENKLKDPVACENREVVSVRTCNINQLGVHVHDSVIGHCACREASVLAVVGVRKHADAVARVAKGSVEVPATFALNNVDDVMGVSLQPVQRAAESRKIGMSTRRF